MPLAASSPVERAWEGWARPRRRGFALVPVFADKGAQRLIRCEACEAPLASVLNTCTGGGLASVRVLCGCGHESALVLTAADATPSAR